MLAGVTTVDDDTHTYRVAYFEFRYLITYG
jgi:hypothetical protein